MIPWLFGMCGTYCSPSFSPVNDSVTIPVNRSESDPKGTVQVLKGSGLILLSLVASSGFFVTGPVYLKTRPVLVTGDQAIERLKLDGLALKDWKPNRSAKVSLHIVNHIEVKCFTNLQLASLSFNVKFNIFILP